MVDTIAWSLNAVSSGGSVETFGSLDVEAVDSASIVVDPQANRALALQFSDVSKLSFVAVKSSLYNAKVKVKGSGDGAKDVVLTGPLVLFGKAIELIGSSLETLTVTNEDAGSVANIEILIGRKLS